jgi:4'-phosphopantetheinyl transferase
MVPGVALWLIDLIAPATPAEIGQLSPSERKRAARFVAERDRRRYCAAHAALRELLGCGSAEFEHGPHGKPHLAGRPAFNLSHSDDVALLATAQAADERELGIDVECLRPIDDAAQLVALHFTAAESREWSATSQAQRDRVFLQGWTRKEACMKALGLGVVLNPSSFEVGLAALPRRVAIEAPRSNLQLTSFEPAAGVIAALARPA